MRDGVRTASPSDLGWDDSLYEEDVARAAAVTGGGPGGRARGGGRRALRWAGGAVALLVLCTGGAGWGYYQHLNSNLSKDRLNLSDNRLDKAPANEAGLTPLNILLLGSDSRASQENQRLGGAKAEATRKPLADVQMLLHLSADRASMSVVSVPRDTRVTIPKCTDPDDGRTYPETNAETINASLQHGGPGCSVATWEKLTGIPVDHFMMIDFAGVVDMADAVGGVPVCVTDNILDSKSGLRLGTGSTTVQGEQALQWLRTRYGFEDGSDIGRAKAQHMYMNSMIRQLKSGTKLTDPGKLRGLAEAATKALTVDDGLGTVKKLYDLGNELKKVPTGRVTMTTMPWKQDPQNPTAHVVPTSDAGTVFSMIREDRALDGGDEKEPAATATPAADEAAPEAEIAVAVQNGTAGASGSAVTGRAAAVTSLLVSGGFALAETDATPKAQVDTTVSYPAAALEADAEAVAAALGLPTGSVRKAPGLELITLVVGADWRSGETYPKVATEAADKVPDSASALNASDEQACMEVNVAGGYSW